MPATSYMTWGTSSASVQIGETISVPYTNDLGMSPNDAGVTSAFNGLATGAVSSGAVSITGVSAGTVTIATDTSVGNSVITANDFTLTVVASADDQNFLNERGLAHFWENIDAAKQDKLTAGTNITIAADNTISATQPTVDSALSSTSINPVRNSAITAALNDKVDVASVDLTNQTTTLLAQIKALGSAQKNYGRFCTKTDGGSANISDKPTGSTNASFVCVAYQSRNNGSSDYTYQVLCWVKSDTNPYTATVTNSTAAISWARQQPDPDATGWVYLGEQSLSADSGTLTYTLPAQYDNYKAVFYGTMASTASDGGWVDFIMLNGSTGINVVHQVQLVEGTTWSSAWNSGTFAMNGQTNPYAGVTITFESFRAGSADWRVYKGSFCSNAGGSATTRSTIVNGRATSGTQPTAFQVKSYNGNFITGSSMRVWASNNEH